MLCDDNPKRFQASFKANKRGSFFIITLPLVQILVIVSFFMALKSMSELPLPGFQTGGLTRLTDFDISCPFLSGANMLSIIETANRESATTSPAAATNQQLQKKPKTRSGS